MDDYRPLPRCSRCNLPDGEDERVLALTGFWHLACVPVYMRETIAEIAGDRPKLLPELLREFRLEFSLEMLFLRDLMEEVIRAAGLEVSVAAVRHLLDGYQDSSPIVIEHDAPITAEETSRSSLRTTSRSSAQKTSRSSLKTMSET